ncbi:hypothetical protein HK405_014474, partial [Cladochytrium tenue]
PEPEPDSAVVAAADTAAAAEPSTINLLFDLDLDAMTISHDRIADIFACLPFTPGEQPADSEREETIVNFIVASTPVEQAEEFYRQALRLVYRLSGALHSAKQFSQDAGRRRTDADNRMNVAEQAAANYQAEAHSLRDQLALSQAQCITLQTELTHTKLAREQDTSADKFMKLEFETAFKGIKPFSNNSGADMDALITGLETFLRSIEILCKFGPRGVSAAISRMPAVLPINDGSWWSKHCEDHGNPSSFEEIRAILNDKYYPSDAADEFDIALRLRTTQGPKETVADFHTRFCKAARRAKGWDTKQLAKHFYYCLDQQIVAELRHSKIDPEDTTIEETYREARIIEDVYKHGRRHMFSRINKKPDSMEIDATK